MLSRLLSGRSRNTPRRGGNVKPAPRPPAAANPDPSAFTAPRLLLVNRDVAHPEVSKLLAEQYIPSCADRCARNALAQLFAHPADPTTTVSATHTVTFILSPMDGVAYATATPEDPNARELHLSVSYFAGLPRENLEAELNGVVTHELTHCFQYNGLGTANGGLIEGIADWVRLRCGCAPPHWRPQAAGKTWDAGYETTAFFLDFLEQRYGNGSVRRINEKLRANYYDENRFWPELFGVSVHDLWRAYAASL